MNIRKLTLFFLLLVSTQIISQSEKNSFKKVIKHYKKTKEKEKQKATEFLINNLEIHKSIVCNWQDSRGNLYPYQETNYGDYIKALEELQVLKDSLGIKPKLIDIWDKDQITSEFLIKNIDEAFKSWKENSWSKSYSFDTFCEYILPYRSLIEPIEEDWRSNSKFHHLNAGKNLIDNNDPVEVCTNILNEMKHFTFVSSRVDPQPLLSLSQLQFRREGNCPDLANYAIMANRALGVATTMDFTPHFAASSNRHFWNTVINNQGEHIPFNSNQGDPYTYDANYRRMGKVLRRTFSIQKETLADHVDPKNIPSVFLKDKNIKDVTKEYVDTSNISYTFFNPSKNLINYISVFNKGEWRVLWWGKSDALGKTIYKDMGRNIVYLPAQIDNENNLKFAPYPLLLHKKGKLIELKPDYVNTYSGIISKENEITANNKDYNTLEFENGKMLKLEYWDKGWKKQNLYLVNDKKIAVKNLPKNALFRLVPEESDGFERIFILDSATYQMVSF